MDALPQITTIIPTFRRPETLKRAIQSVLNQSYPHFQVCIYDNASGDETAAVVKEFMQKDPRVKYHCHPTNIGSNANFQYGLENVNTPYFSFLSDDDFVFPEFYETTLEGFTRYPEIAFCAGQTISIYQDGTISLVKPDFEGERYFSQPFGALEFLHGIIPTWGSILFRREAIEHIGPLKLDMISIDIDFIGRITLEHPFFLKSKPCAVLVNHPDSITWKASIDAYYPDVFNTILRLKSHPSLSEDFRHTFHTALMRKLNETLFFIGREHLWKKDFVIAARVSQILCGPLNAWANGLFLNGQPSAAKRFPDLFSCSDPYIIFSEAHTVCSGLLQHFRKVISI